MISIELDPELAIDPGRIELVQETANELLNLMKRNGLTWEEGALAIFAVGSVLKNAAAKREGDSGYLPG